MLYNFVDYYGNHVELSFNCDREEEAKHVFVICQSNGKWLLTKHLHRGMEFPGGKVENGEVPMNAARREVMEETGGIVTNLHYIGQYRVDGKEKLIIKNIYFAQVDTLEKKEHYFETAGPVLLDEIPKNIKRNNKFSFMMRDEVVEHSLKRVREMYQI